MFVLNTGLVDQPKKDFIFILNILKIKIILKLHKITLFLKWHLCHYLEVRGVTLPSSNIFYVSFLFYFVFLKKSLTNLSLGLLCWLWTIMFTQNSSNCEKDLKRIEANVSINSRLQTNEKASKQNLFKNPNKDK